jgi:hypothetical protein
MPITEREEWKLFADGNYSISNMGRVKRVTAGRKTWPGRMLKLTLMKIGYHQVRPVIAGRNVAMYVHALVAAHFIGDKPPLHEVNHKDGDKTNNVASNLEYVTHAENMQHAFRNNLVDVAKTIDTETIDAIRTLRIQGLSYSAVSKATGVSVTHCWNVVKNNKRKAG